MNTIEQIETKRGYHFTADILRNGDPIPAIGAWISVQGPIIPCKSGLHMSEHPFDALQYAPGHMLHLVDIRGDLQPNGDPVDKWVGRERRIIATIDATDILRVFARFCALSVAHLWDCPDIVRRYLETGDESIMEAARDAAREAAVAAARAARDAAWAAWDAAVAPARDAAREAAVAAARAAWDEAWDAARAARDAACEGQREKLQTLVDEAFKKELSK